jgi:hypothetical protein
MKGKELRAFLRVAEGAQDEKRAQPASERAPEEDVTEYGRKELT